jgi:hypothetical protein
MIYEVFEGFFTNLTEADKTIQELESNDWWIFHEEITLHGYRIRAKRDKQGLTIT